MKTKRGQGARDTWAPFQFEIVPGNWMPRTAGEHLNPPRGMNSLLLTNHGGPYGGCLVCMAIGTKKELRQLLGRIRKGAADDSKVFGLELDRARILWGHWARKCTMGDPNLAPLGSKKSYEESFECSAS